MQRSSPRHRLATVAVIPLLLLATSCSAKRTSGVIVDPPPPFLLLRVEPTLNQREVPTDTILKLTFNRNVDPRGLTAALQLFESGNPVPFLVELPELDSVILRPTDELLPDRDYQFRVLPTVRSADGAVLQHELQGTFHTAATTSWHDVETLATIPFTPAADLRVAFGGGGIGAVAWNEATGGWRARWWLLSRWQNPVTGGPGVLHGLGVDALGNGVALESALTIGPDRWLLRARNAGAGAAFASDVTLAERPPTAGGEFSSVDFALDIIGGGIATWLEGNGAPRTLGLAVRRSTGAWEAKAFPIQESPTAAPRVGIHRAGFGVAHWQVVGDESWFAVRQPSGAMEPPARVPGYPAGDVVVAVGGSVHVWLGGDPDAPEIQLRTLRGDGAPGPTQTIAQSSRKVSSVQVAVGHDGTVLVAWLNEDRELYARRYDPARGLWDIVEQIAVGVGSPREHGQGIDEPFAIAVDGLGTSRIVWRSSVGLGAPVRARIALYAEPWRGAATLEPGPQSSTEVMNLRLVGDDPALVHAVWIALPATLPGQMLVRTARPR